MCIFTAQIYSVFEKWREVNELCFCGDRMLVKGKLIGQKVTSLVTVHVIFSAQKVWLNSVTILLFWDNTLSTTHFLQYLLFQGQVWGGGEGVDGSGWDCCLRQHRPFPFYLVHLGPFPPCSTFKPPSSRFRPPV